MTFEVPVEAVSRPRGRRGMVAVTAAFALIIVGAAIAGSWFPQPATPIAEVPEVLDAAAPPPTPDSMAPAGGQPTSLSVPETVPLSRTRPLPTDIECNNVVADECRRLVRAAIRVLPEDLPVIRTAAVWGSLVCNDTFDCPPTHLRYSEALGSVIVSFIDGSPGAAINVVDWRYGSAIRLGLRAWVARTVPATD